MTQTAHPAPIAHPTAYPSPYPTPVAPAPARTNTFAVLSVVFLFVFSPLAVVFGFLGRREIERTGQRGRGLALTGIIAGSISMVLGVVTAVLLVVGLSVGAAEAAQVAGPDVAASITSQTHGRVQNAHCGALPARIGASTTCTADIDGAPGRLEVTVNSTEGTQIGFHYRQIA